MQICVIPTVPELNRRVAAQIASVLARAITTRGRARLVAATGSSQLGMLDELIKMPGIDWPRVELFHLDEYLGLPAAHPASFARFMRDRVIARTGITAHHLIDGTGNPEEVIDGLTRALRARPVDLAITGIGENGHLAFNEPPADFEATAAFTVVALDETSRRQQVGEEWFSRVEDVPTHAITMTIPEILKAEEIVCMAFGLRKAQAVASCFNAEPTPNAPASRLTSHAATTVYLDGEAASHLLPSVVAARA